VGRAERAKGPTGAPGEAQETEVVRDRVESDSGSHEEGRLTARPTNHGLAIVSPIRTPAVAATGGGRRAAGIELRHARYGKAYPRTSAAIFAALPLGEQSGAPRESIPDLP
jgi:hypothetical protein